MTTKYDNYKYKGGGPTRAPLEYYDDFANSDGVGASATIVLRDDDTDYGLSPPYAAGASNNDGADVRCGKGSRGN